MSCCSPNQRKAPLPDGEDLGALCRSLVLEEKLTGAGLLSAGVAHEINNPNNFIGASAQVLSAELGDLRRFLNSLLDADQEELRADLDGRFARLESMAANVITGSRRIDEIVKGLKSFTRLDEAELKPVALADCVRSALNMLHPNWRDAIDFRVRTHDDLVMECWPALLNQAFLNLLLNGCQAVSDRKADSPQHRGLIEVEMHAKEGSVEIAFTDNGQGIPLDAQERIFEPFFTTRSVGEGSGLGLSIAHSIVQRHKGELAFTSTPGLGSCFVVRLPLRL